MTTDKTIKSKYQPKQTNVTWVDLSGKTPVEKHFINGRWQAIGGGSGSGSNTNPGYNVTKQTVTLFNDTIETQGSGGMYQGFVGDIDFDLVAGENYTVVFDGTSYDIKAISASNDVILGELNDGHPSFDTYPFFIYNGTYDGIKKLGLITNIEGSHTVKIEHLKESVETTHDFESAVKDVLLTNKKNLLIYPDTIDSESSTVTAVYNKKFVTGNTYIVPFKDSSGIRFLPFYLEYIEYHYPEGEPSIDSPIMTSIMTDRIGSWIRDDNGTIAFIPEVNGLSDGYIIRIESYDGINWRCYLVYYNGGLS
jgi:hypothetical protein